MQIKAVLGISRKHVVTGSFESVKDLKISLSKEAEIDSSNIVTTFAGHVLSDEDRLNQVPGLKEKSTLQCFHKPAKPAKSNVADGRLEMVCTSLLAAVSDRHQRYTLQTLMRSPESLTNLLAAVPALREDLMAQGVLRDLYLLGHWMSPTAVEKTAREHPSLVEATEQLMHTLHSEMVSSAGTSAVPPHVQVMLGETGFGDSDDSDGENANPRQAQVAPNFPGGAFGGLQQPSNRPITAAQLAQALASATGTGSSTGTPPARQPPSDSRRSAGGGGVITPSAFQAAMQQIMTSPAQPQQQQTATSAVDPEGLAQLREMGFMDADENSRALRATGGDVEAALEWIINQREQMDQD